MSTNILSDLLRKSATMVEGVIDEEDVRREFYRDKPAKWCHDELGMDLTDFQAEVLTTLNSSDETKVRDCAVRTGHSVGKSGMAAAATLHWLDTRTHSKVMTTAPGERQLKHILWAEIGARFAGWKRRHQWSLTRGMNLYRKDHPASWFALGIYSGESDKIEGFHTEKEGNLLVIIDEAKAVPNNFFTAVASMVGRRLMTSVPPLNARGYFVDAFSKFRNLWKCFHMSSLDSPFVTEAWINARKIDWVEGSPVWTAKILGDFPTNLSQNLVINPGQVEDAQQRFNGKKFNWSIGNIGVGVDVARFGDDRTVLLSLVGSQVERIVEKAKFDTMATVGIVTEQLRRLSEEAKKYEVEIEAKQIPVAVDDTGLGGGVVDRLGELEYNVIPINFAWKAEDSENYMNLRSEMWFQSAQALEGIAIPDDDAMMGAGARLAAELTSVQFQYTSTGKKLEPKEAAKKRSGSSPDIADAFVLAVKAIAMQGMEAGGVEVW